MSTCGSSLRQIFESTIQEKNSSSSSLIESLSSSLKQIRPVKPPLRHSFTEIFGELHFKESSEPIYSSSSTVSYNGGGDDNKWWNNCADDSNKRNAYHKKSDSFSSLNSESLQLCTEGLGSESLDYMEDLKIDNDMSGDNYCFTGCKMGEKSSYYRGNSVDQYRKRRTDDGETFPPPISCIGKTGKPSVWFQSFREDGRFVLKEVRIPTYERLHASREDGNLRLRFIQPFDRDDDDEGEEQRKVKEETEVAGDIEGGHS